MSALALVVFIVLSITVSLWWLIGVALALFWLIGEGV